ncbi:MAG: MoxR family ATPase [Planctomycetales bacterium]|nr:MoxR family ATPase [Planctomycetales bacterium]
MPISALEIERLTAQIQIASAPLRKLLEEVQKVVVGQHKLMHRMLVSLLARGHLLIEGVPGLAKTTAVATVARGLNVRFQRLQFTPDLLPADLIGTQVYRPQDQSFVVQKGPIFANLILADEINRAPAKVQSALLEAMQERQVTIGGTTYVLDDPFLVMATQNPVEQEGTYPLPEAQTDRFMLKVLVDYPSRQEELLILDRMGRTRIENHVNTVVDPQGLASLSSLMDQVYIDQRVREYIVDIIMATRRPKEYGLDIQHLIQYGGSPRATINLTLAARANALLDGRGYVTPSDVKDLAPDVLRHRVVVTYEAEAEEKSSDDIISLILNKLPVP